MGHDIHFLERLDRLGTNEVEFALSLYRDAEMVRWILSRARLPEQAERVAVALTASENPPHVIVARNGRFVTCLAPGMNTGKHPIVSRGLLDKIVAERVGYRESREHLAARGESEARMWSKLFAVGSRLSREDFELCAAFAPLIETELLHLFLESLLSLAEMTPRVVRLHRRGRLRDELSYDYWRHVHASSHLAVLAFLPGESLWKQAIDEEMERSFSRLFRPLTQTTSSTILRRHAWCVGRAGWSTIRGFKQRYVESWSNTDVLHSWSGLAGISAAHRRARGEVMKHLEAIGERPPKDEGDLGGPLRQWCRKTLAGFFAAGDGERRPVTEELRVIGHEMLRMRFEHSDDPVARDLALGGDDSSAMIANYERFWFDPRIDATERTVFLLSIPFAARLDAAQLFLPRALIDVIPGWHPSRVESMLEVPSVENPPAEPVRARPTPGRNEPCSCGSGTKFKRCCGS